jgi:mono/diheme cytochrome c family protein
MKITYVIAFGISTAFATTAFAELELGDAAKLPPAATKAGVTYEKDIKAIFEKSCLKCHSGEKPKGKFSMESLAKILKGGGDGVSVVPGNSAKSALVHMASDLVKDSEMPPTDKRDKYAPLTKEQIGLVRAWIDQGAK